jgi:hypothetical protein
VAGAAEDGFDRRADCCFVVKTENSGHGRSDP